MLARRNWFIAIGLFLFAIGLSAAHAEGPLRVCLVSGSEEYESDKSLAAFQQYLAAGYNVETTLLKARGFEELPGLEALDEADVALFFTRRLTIGGEPLERIKKYCESGRPIVAVRTASHGFQNWLEFDKLILGGNYQGHFGNGPAMTATAVPDAADDPLLAGVGGAIQSKYSLYKTLPLAENARVLMTGETPESGGPQPVTWTREHNGGRVFYTSLGGVEDFESADFRRLLANALFWTAKLEPATRLAATAPGDAPQQTARILMVTQSAGFKHGSVTRAEEKLSPAETALTEIGVASGLFRVDCTQDVARDFTKESLANYDIVFFYTTGTLPIDAETLDYFFKDWLKQKGHGFVGTHSATDTFHDYQPYWDMIGGTFDGHPWGSDQKVAITVHDQQHPAAAPWGEEFEIQDEIYRFKNWQPEKVRVLMSLNMAKTALKAPYHVPIAWVKEYGGGKVFYISLGHREDVWTNERYRASLLGGIRWILGQEQGDATPNPDLSSAQEAKAKTDAQ